MQLPLVLGYTSAGIKAAENGFALAALPSSRHVTLNISPRRDIRLPHQNPLSSRNLLVIAFYFGDILSDTTTKATGSFSNQNVRPNQRIGRYSKRFLERRHTVHEQVYKAYVSP